MCHPSGLAAYGTGVSSDRDAIKNPVRPRARNESQTLKRKPSWMIAGGVNGFGYPVKAQHMEGRPWAAGVLCCPGSLSLEWGCNAHCGISILSRNLGSTVVFANGNGLGEAV